MPNSGKRRDFLRWLLGFGLVTSITSFLYPAIRFLSPPRTSQASVDEVVGAHLGELKPNTGKIVKFGTRPVILIRVTESEYKAFSAVCTHLSCIVQYDAQRHLIWCPCHDGRYNLNGNVIGGPPPRPLQPYEVRVRGEDIVITRNA